jgi:hypothetical protein
MEKLTSFLKKKIPKIEKRFRLVIGVLFSTLIMLFSTFYFFDRLWIFIPLLIISSIFSVYFVLLDKIEKVGWFGFFFMPTFLSISFYLFYFLFPGRWLTRFPFIIFYAISFYANLLITNIFFVGAQKNLALYRAAFSVNFLYQTIIAFFIFNVLFFLRQNFLINMLFVALIVFLLALHLFWSIRIKIFFEKEVVFFAFLLAIMASEITFLLSIIPIKPTIASLFLTSFYYSLAGMFYHLIDEKLFKETIREYLIVLGFVSIITLLTLSW